MQCLVAQSCLTLCNLMDCSLPGSTFHGDSPGKNTEVGCHALLQGIKPRSLTLQVDSLPSEPPGKPKNTEVGSLSLLQGIFVFLLAILIPAGGSSSPAFHMVYSAYKLHKHGDRITALMFSFPNFEPVYCSMSSSNFCFLTCIQVS